MTLLWEFFDRMVRPYRQSEKAGFFTFDTLLVNFFAHFFWFCLSPFKSGSLGKVQKLEVLQAIFRNLKGSGFTLCSASNFGAEPA